MMIYIGIDVSKAKLDCMWLRDPIAIKGKSKVLANTRQGHRELKSWLLKNTKAEAKDIHVTLEATNVYHEAVAHYLFEQGFQVSVVNPARPKEYAKSLGIVHKTDKKDSLLLARFGHGTNPKRWQPEPAEVRELKALITRLEALEGDLQREENRLESSAISASSELVIESLNKMIQGLKAEKKRLTKEIDNHIDRHPQLKKNRALLETIPGVGPVLSRVMLSVIASKSFKKASQVAAYLGLVPKMKETGTFKGKTVLSKQGPGKIRAKLYMPAVVATKINPDICCQYERLKKQGKSSMSALGAAMRKLVHICFGVIKHQCEYIPQATM